jgi:hypothetical protein
VCLGDAGDVTQPALFISKRLGVCFGDVGDVTRPALFVSGHNILRSRRKVQAVADVDAGRTLPCRPGGRIGRTG